MENSLLKIIKRLLFITGMLILLGIYIKEYINEAMIGDATSGCDLNYAEAEALDEDEARFCRAKKLEAD